MNEFYYDQMTSEGVVADGQRNPLLFTNYPLDELKRMKMVFADYRQKMEELAHKQAGLSKWEAKSKRELRKVARPQWARVLITLILVLGLLASIILPLIPSVENALMFLSPNAGMESEWVVWLRNIGFLGLLFLIMAGIVWLISNKSTQFRVATLRQDIDQRHIEYSEWTRMCSDIQNEIRNSCVGIMPEQYWMYGDEILDYYFDMRAMTLPQAINLFEQEAHQESDICCPKCGSSMINTQIVTMGGGVSPGKIVFGLLLLLIPIIGWIIGIIMIINSKEAPVVKNISTCQKCGASWEQKY